MLTSIDWAIAMPALHTAKPQPSTAASPPEAQTGSSRPLPVEGDHTRGVPTLRWERSADTQVCCVVGGRALTPRMRILQRLIVAGRAVSGVAVASKASPAVACPRKPSHVQGGVDDEPGPVHGARRAAGARIVGSFSASCAQRANSHSLTRFGSSPSRSAILRASATGSSARRASQLSMCWMAS